VKKFLVWNFEVQDFLFGGLGASSSFFCSLKRLMNKYFAIFVKRFLVFNICKCFSFLVNKGRIGIRMQQKALSRIRIRLMWIRNHGCVSNNTDTDPGSSLQK
jgi:hypothetical protein